MAEITALMVKDLRTKTGAGMADCKKALEETNGNMEEAIDFLRKKGAASISKRADRSANEGYCAARVSADNKTAVLIAVTCETDFVARNQGFVDFANICADTFIANPSIDNVDELKVASANGTTIVNLYNGILAKFSEKIDISKATKFSTEGFFNVYIHGGSKLAVIVDFATDQSGDKISSISKDIAMQIAAMSPMFVDRTSVDQDVIERERAIYRDQVIAEGKKPEFADKIVDGRIDKFYKENCLIEQSFVKDGSKTVSEVVKEISSETSIKSFVRYNIGE